MISTKEHIFCTIIHIVKRHIAKNICKMYTKNSAYAHME